MPYIKGQNTWAFAKETNRGRRKPGSVYQDNGKSPQRHSKIFEGKVFRESLAEPQHSLPGTGFGLFS
jgi:hypothetical protein